MVIKKQSIFFEKKEFRMMKFVSGGVIYIYKLI